MSSFQFEVWPTEYRVITQHFGSNPHYYRQFGLPGHEGVDLRAPSGSKIFCVAPGRVYVVQNNPKGHNYGIHVRVQHAGGYVTTYAHLQEAFVGVGDDVQAGSVLGLADNTGNSFGSHLHLTLKKRGAKVGNWPKEIIDPTPFLMSLMGWQLPTGPYLKGWVANLSISIVDDLAQALSGGVTLRLGPDENLHVPEGTIMIVNGSAQSGFVPVLVSQAAVGQFLPGAGETGSPRPPMKRLSTAGPGPIFSKSTIPSGWCAPLTASISANGPPKTAPISVWCGGGARWCSMEPRKKGTCR